MRTQIRYSVCLLLLYAGWFWPAAGQATSEIVSYLPGSGEVEGWTRTGDARVAEGEDLFLLINGGADIYEEYGFRKTVYQSYRNGTGSSVNLEIYEMVCPECAYGIYTFKTSPDGKPVRIGHEGWMEEYYLNFRKGRFLITLIALDTEPSTLEAMVKLAEAVDRKITDCDQIPGIVRLMPLDGLVGNGITYLKGQLGLFNRYFFGNRNIFGVREGVFGQYTGNALFIFSYDSSVESRKWFESARSTLRKSEIFHGFSDHGEHTYSMKDHGGNTITVQSYRHTILIHLASGDSDALKVFAVVQHNIDHSGTK